MFDAIPLPLPWLGQIPGVDLGISSDPSTIASGSQAISELASQLWDKNWQDALHGQVYKAITRLGLVISALILAIFILRLAKSLIDDETDRAYEQIFWVFVVFLLMFNNGAVLIQGTEAMRFLINRTNSEVLEVVSSDIGVQQQLAVISNFQDMKQQLAAKAAACDQATANDEFIVCLNKARADIREIMAKHPEIPRGSAWWKKLTDFANAAVVNPFDAAKTAGEVALNAALRTATEPIMSAITLLLFGFQGASQMMVEATLLLTALLGPLAVATTLLPVGAKPIFAWLAAFWGVAITKLSLTIVTGLITTVTYNQGSVQALPTAVALGIFAPVIALGMGAGGGMTLFTSFTSMIRTGSNVAVAFATRR